MKPIVYILCFLFFLSYTSAKEIFSDVVIESYNQEINGVKLNIIIGEESVSVKYGNIGGILQNDECRELDNIKICVSEFEALKAKITIEEKEGILILTKNVVDDILEKDKAFKIMVVLENSGEASISGVKYEDDPGDLIVDNLDGCDYNNGKIIWEGNLLAGNKHECTYYLKSLTTGDFSINGIVSYNNEIIKKDLEVNIPDELSVNLLLEEDMVYVGKKFNLTIILENNLEKDIKINTFDIKIPDGLRILNSNIKLEDIKYKEKEYNIEILAEKEGNYKLEVVIDYVSNKEVKIIKSKDLSALRWDLDFRVEVNDDKVSLVVENPDEGEDITDIHFETISILKELNLVKDINSLKAGNKEYIFKDVTINNAVNFMLYSLTVKYNYKDINDSSQLKIQFNRDIGEASLIVLFKKNLL